MIIINLVSYNNFFVINDKFQRCFLNVSLMPLRPKPYTLNPKI